MEDTILNSILKLSDRLPPYFVEQYERMLAIINVSLLRPSQHTPKDFWDLYTTLSSLYPPSKAVTYTYRILEGLGWIETSIRVFIDKDLTIDSRISDEIKMLKKNNTPYSVINDILNSLDYQLGKFQCDRYHLALSVLTKSRFPRDKTFLELYEIAKMKVNHISLAVAFTSSVLKRAGWGDTRRLKIFATPNFQLERDCPNVDLCLTVADYFSNMSEPDYRSAKVLISMCHLDGRMTDGGDKIDFVLLLLNSDVISSGDVSKVEDIKRYPIFFNEYKERCKELSSPKNISSKLMVIPQMETHNAQEGTTTELSGGMSFAMTCTGDDEFDGVHSRQSSTDNQPQQTGATSLCSDGSSVENTYQTTAMTETADIESILDTAPEVAHVLKLLLPISHQWELLGMALNINPDQRPNSSSSTSAVICLGKVLEEWKRSECSKVTWRNLLEVVNGILSQEIVADTIKQFLSDRENFNLYSRKK